MSKDKFDIEAAKIMFNCAKCDSDQEFRYTALLCLEAIEEARKTIDIKDGELECNYDNISRLLKNIDEARKEVSEHNLTIIKIRQQVWEHRDQIDKFEAIIEKASCSICGTLNLSPQHCSHVQPCRPVYAKLEKANSRILELEQQIEEYGRGEIL